MCQFVRGVVQSVAVLAVLWGSGPGLAADVAGLSWGEFVAGEADQAKIESIDATASGVSLAAKLALHDVEAKAEGETTAASAQFSGQFLVSQPASARLQSLTVTVSGLIIKTAGTEARIDLTIGSSKTAVSWTADDVKSERYSQQFTFVIADGKMASPFAVAASATASKPVAAGAVLVSLDKITITAGEALVGAIDVPATKKPEAPLAPPALVASRN